MNIFKIKIKKVFCIVVILISIIIIGILVFVYSSKIIYHDFYKSSRLEFEIPEIHSGFVPQGFEYCEAESVFLISGYMHNNNDSKIYVVHPDGSNRKLSILNADGSVFKSHSGGISSFGEYIYLAGCDEKCYVLSRETIMNSNYESVKVIGSFDVYNNADFCYIKNDKLYTGEYYHSFKYATDDSHHLITPAGDKNNAIMTVFELDDSMKLGVGNTPIAVYSITGRIQGMCITDNSEVVLSASSGFSSSELYFYDFGSIHNEAPETIALDVPVPLYYMDSNNLIKTVSVLPKSEGLVFYDGRVYILFESASNKFILGKFIGGEFVYSIDIQNND